MKKTYSQFNIISKQIEGKQSTLLFQVCLPMQMAPMNPCQLKHKNVNFSNLNFDVPHTIESKLGDLYHFLIRIKDAVKGTITMSLLLIYYYNEAVF